MIKQLTLAAAALVTVGAGLAPVAADAQRWRGDRYERQYRGDYYGDGRVYRDRNWNNARGRQRCSNGDGGTIIGALAGGLLGNQVAGRHDRLLGTVIGGGAGALAGRAIDRSGNRGFCR